MFCLSLGFFVVWGFCFVLFKTGEGKQACKIVCKCPKQHHTAPELHIWRIPRSYH